MAYGKIFESLFTGSMVGSGSTVFAVWAYVIASTRPPGIIEIHPKLLATVIGCPQAEVEAAVELLCSPDPDSRTHDHDGRRLLPEGRFCYSVVNWERYRMMRDDETRRIQNREAQRRWRNRSSSASATRKQPSAPSAQADADALSPLRGDTAAGAAPVVDSLRASPRLPDSSGGDIATSTSVPTSPNAASEQGAATTTPPATSSPRSGQAKAVPVPKPADVTDAVWQDWLAHRRAKKSTVTQRVLDDTRRKATAAGMTMDEALTHWVAQGYAGFFPPASKPGSSGGATFDRSGVIMKSAPPGYYSGPAVQDL